MKTVSHQRNLQNATCGNCDSLKVVVVGRGQFLAGVVQSLQPLVLVLNAADRHTVLIGNKQLNMCKCKDILQSKAHRDH